MYMKVKLASPASLGTDAALKFHCTRLYVVEDVDMRRDIVHAKT